MRSTSRDSSRLVADVVAAGDHGDGDGDDGDGDDGDVHGPAQRRGGEAEIGGNAGGHIVEDVVRHGEGGVEEAGAHAGHKEQQATGHEAADHPSHEVHQHDAARPQASSTPPPLSSTPPSSSQSCSAIRRPEQGQEGQGERQTVAGTCTEWCLLDAFVGEAWDRICSALDARAIGRLGATCSQIRGMAGGQALWQKLCFHDWGTEGWADGGVSIGLRVVTKLRGEGRRLDQVGEIRPLSHATISMRNGSDSNNDRF
jgi:hypothetical protein